MSAYVAAAGGGVRGRDRRLHGDQAPARSRHRLLRRRDADRDRRQFLDHGAARLDGGSAVQGAVKRAAERCGRGVRSATAGCARGSHAFLDDVARAHPDYHCRPVAAVRASRVTAPDRRARAGPARRQPHRPAVHRRSRGHPAVPDAARARLCARAPSPSARDDGLQARRLPHHERREVPAARQQADCRPKSGSATAISTRELSALARAASSSRSGRSRTARSCAPGTAAARQFASRTAPSTRLPGPARCSWIPSLQPLNTQHRPPDARHVRPRLCAAPGHLIGA